MFIVTHMYIISSASKGIILLTVSGYSIRYCSGLSFLKENCRLTNVYLIAIAKAERAKVVLWQHMKSLPSDRAAKVFPNLLFSEEAVLKNLPF